MKVNNKILLLAWFAIITASVFYIIDNVRIQSDMSVFFPEDGQMDKSFVHAMQQSQKGMAARLLMVSLSGATSTKLAESNKGLLGYLEKHPDVFFANNGQQALSADNRELLFKYRFLLSPAMDEQTFSQAELKLAFTQRLRELTSMTSMLDKRTISRDPVMLVRTYLKGLTGVNQPRRLHGVWFTEDAQQSVLLLYLKESVQSNEKTGAFIESLQDWIKSRQSDNVILTVSGPGMFAYEARKAIERETQLFSVVGSLIIMLVIYLAYRSVSRVFLAALPLITGLLLAVSVTHFFFSGLHGITLAFGVILLGIGIDYPIHFFSHLRQKKDGWTSVKGIWPTILIGVISSGLGFSVMLLSRFEGLQQLGVFSVTGLIVAAVVTRWVLPGIVLQNRLYTSSTQGYFLPYRILLIMRLPLILFALFIPVAALIYGNSNVLDRDMRQLSPVPDDVFVQDKLLRQQLHVPDATRFLIIEADTSEAVLRKTEKLSRDLDEAHRQGLFSAYQSVTQMLPSKQTQLRRQALLPVLPVLKENIGNALKGMPFKQTAFNGFIADVETSKTLPLLTMETLTSQMSSGLLSLKLGMMMQQKQNGWVSYIQLYGVDQPDSLRQWMVSKQHEQVSLIDITGTANNLMGHYQRDVIEKSLYGFLLITVILVLTLKSFVRVIKVLLPVIFAIILTISILLLGGEALTLFHLVSLLLVLGIGMDYGLFMTRDENNEAAHDTLHSLLVCVVSTTMVFSIIAFSDILVIHAIGVTVAIGVLCSFILSVLVVLPQNRNHNKLL